MTKRIQAYFRTEDDAEGAKTALIAYDVEGLDVWPLTDPLGRDSRILVPLIPLGNSALASGGFSVAGTSGSPGAGAALVAGARIEDTDNELDNRDATDRPREDEISDSDRGELHYVMELKVEDSKYNEVVQILRGKQAYVELFD